MINHWRQKTIQALKTSIFYERLVLFCILFAIPITVSSLTLDIYTVIKWKLVHVFILFALFHLCFIQKRIPFPRVNRLFAFAFFSIIALWGFEYFFHHIPFVSEVTADRIGFIALSLYFLHLFKKDPRALDIISYALILSMVAFMALLFYDGGLSLSDLFQSIPIHGKIRYSFGNENMAAQFFGLSIIATFRYLFTQKKLAFRAILALLLICFSVLLIKVGCRSVLIGSALGCIFYAVMQLTRYRKNIIICGILAGLIAIPLLLIMRPQTVQHRLEMWQNAAAIAKDYPLGVGRGKFAFYHVLYQQEDQVSPRAEGLIERTPHNEVLKHLAEEGWLYILLAFMLIGSFLYRSRKSLLKSFQQSETTQAIGAFAFLLLVELCLQFPFELALPYFMLTIVTGYFLSLTPKHENIAAPLLVSIPLFVGMTTVISFLWLAELAHGIKRNDKAFVARACTLAPYAWRTCEIHLRHLLKENKPVDAAEEALQHLSLRPYNFLTLYRLGYAYTLSGRKDLVCKLAWFHDRLFYHRSRLRKFVLAKCPQKDQETLLALPIKDHYRALFTDLPPHQQKALHHNT
jgi:hypothetical protein